MPTKTRIHHVTPKLANEGSPEISTLGTPHSTCTALHKGAQTVREQVQRAGHAGACHRVSAHQSRNMVNWLNTLLYGLGGLLCTCMVLLVTFQEKLVYVPVIPGLSKGYSITPARFSLQYEDVWLFAADGVRLHCWFIKSGARESHWLLASDQNASSSNSVPAWKSHSRADGPTARGKASCAAAVAHDDGAFELQDSLSRSALSIPLHRPTILFFQENAGNIAHRLEFVEHMLGRLKCNVLLLSYRGYGASDGQPSQTGLTQDAEAALNHLLQRSDIDTRSIFVFGRSLGGAVGATLVKNNPGKVSGIILENTFTSVLDMAGVIMPYLKWFVGRTGNRGPKLLNPLVRSPWSTVDVITEIREPILFLSGMRDEMVPPVHMRRLYEAANQSINRTFIEFPTGMHMDTWLRGGDRYWRVIQLFLERFSVAQGDRSPADPVGLSLCSQRKRR